MSLHQRLVLCESISFAYACEHQIAAVYVAEVPQSSTKELLLLCELCCELVVLCGRHNNWNQKRVYLLCVLMTVPCFSHALLKPFDCLWVLLVGFGYGLVDILTNNVKPEL